MNFLKAFSIATYLMGWYTRASMDGEITEAEMAEAVIGALRVADVDIAVHVPSVLDSDRVEGLDGVGVK